METEHQPRKNIFYQKPWLGYFLGTLIIGLTLDFGIAAVLSSGITREIRTSHPYYHHGLLPNRHTLEKWGNISYDMYTNSLGMRDVSVRNVPLQSDKYRLLLMGDSHTEGVGVQFEESIAGYLRQLLDTSKVEILNSGVVSYSPSLYYLRTKYLIEEEHLAFDAMHVLIDISDVQNEYAYQSFQSKESGNIRYFGISIHRFFNRFSFLYSRIYRLYQQHQRDVFYKTLTRQQIAHNNTMDLYETFFRNFDDQVLLSNPQFHSTLTEWYADESLYQKWGRQGSQWMVQHMQALVDLCKRHGIELMISVHPWINNIRKGNSDDLHVQFWRKFAVEQGIGFINLYPVFIQGNSPDSIIANYYIPKDNHWNKFGHQKVAKKLYRYFSAAWVHKIDTTSRIYPGLMAAEKYLYDSAEEYLSHYLREHPQDGYARFILAREMIREGEFDSASIQLNKALITSPRLTEAVSTKSQLPLYVSLHEVNIQLSKDTTALQLSKRGKLQFQLGNAQQAQKDFIKANELDPKLKEPYYYLGHIMHRVMNNPSGATRYLNRAIELDSQYIEAYRERAEVLSKLGNEPGKQRDLRIIQELSNK